MTDAPERRGRLTFWVLSALLVLLPFLFGGVYEWTIFLAEIVVLALFGVSLAQKQTGADAGETPVLAPFPHGRAFRIFIFVFFAVSLLQILPLPPAGVRFLSPRMSDIFESAKPFNLLPPNPPAWPTLSLAPNLTVYEIVKDACYALFVYLLFSVITTGARVRTLATLIIFGGILEAAYGLFEFVTGRGTIYGWKNIHISGAAFGTFVNRNHFAGFLEMTFFVGIGLFLDRISRGGRERSAASVRERIVRIGEKSGQKSFALLAGLLLVGGGVFASKSRSGVLIVVAVLAFGTALMIAARKARDASRFGGRFAAATLGGTLILVVAAGVFFTGDLPIAERLSKKNLGRTGRLIYAKKALDIALDFPAAGTGLGTFVTSQGFYERNSDRSVLRHAHNDYLECIAESGVIGGGALILLALAGFGVLFNAWRKASETAARGIGLGCLLGITAILLHSLTDFNLRIPSNVLMFLSLYVLGYRAVTLSDRGARRAEIDA
jgi:putative inorganic carbon (HCO3(-)) transporter